MEWEHTNIDMLITQTKNNIIRNHKNKTKEIKLSGIFKTVQIIVKLNLWICDTPDWLDIKWVCVVWVSIVSHIEHILGRSGFYLQL